MTQDWEELEVLIREGLVKVGKALNRMTVEGLDDPFSGRVKGLLEAAERVLGIAADEVNRAVRTQGARR